MPTTPTPGINFVVWLIALVALGFIMMLLFKAAVWWGERPPVAPRVRSYPMSSRARVPTSQENDGSRRSAAVEQGSEPSGSQSWNPVPDLAEELAILTDDARLEVFAQMKDDDGNYVYADSRIAKFIGGRVEDRVKQVRDVRGKELPPPKPAPQLRVRADGYERLIDKYGN